MQLRSPRAVSAVVLLTSALLVALITPARAAAPEGDLGPPAHAAAVAATPAAAAGSGEYSPVEWLPLRGTVDIGCTYMSPGPYCGGSHHGYHAIDMGGSFRQPVYAAGGGIARVYETSRGCSGYGVTVVVDHGPYGSSLYAHLDGYPQILVDNPNGVWVDENTVIGYVGHTGSISDCALNHLHFEHWVNGVWESSSVRSPTPDLKGCVGNELRTYPDYFGQDTWQYLPSNTYDAVNDGTGCTGGPTGALEGSAGALGGYAQLRGWVFDPDDKSRSSEVHVYVDGPAGSGAPGTAIVANRSRPDVAWSYPGVGDAHGFHAAIGGLSPGTHQLFVYAINLDGTPGEHLVLGTPTITVPTPQAGMPTGAFDTATSPLGGQVRVAGWALDPDVISVSTQVQVFIDGPASSGARSVLIDATVSRPDIASAFPGAGPLHGFDATIDDIEPGVVNLWIYAVNSSGPAGNPLIGMRAVDVAQYPTVCVAGAESGPFTDVAPTHSFCADIEWMDRRGIDVGYPDGTYAPALPNTRAMMADQLYNFAGKPAFTPPATSPFSDVPVGHPLYLQISWLSSTGIATGYDDGTFKPDASVTRQAMAAFFYRMAGSPDLTGITATLTQPFSDVTSEHPFFDPIVFLATEDVTTGYQDGTFRPGALITRQAMAAFLHRYATL